MSTNFQAASPMMQKLDPSKRVNYTFGLVLGVEEFLQSDVYFLAKHHLGNRLLHGYGTACGLDIVVQTTPQLEVQVTPGWAINPKGQEMQVSQLMCLQVNDWLQANLKAIQALFPGPSPSGLRVCVVMCYRECLTDVVPIPGEPCQTQTSSMAPSRIKDSFELMLCLDPDTSPPLSSPLSSPPSGPLNAGGLLEFRPSQVEDDSVRAFVTLLSEIQTSPVGPFLTLDQLEQLVRELGQGLTSPPSGSPPSGPPYFIHNQDEREFLRAAFRTWITEVRPLLGSQGASACCPPPEKCVLLAELTLSLNAGWAATAVTVDQSRRPFLVPTRLLQELAFGGSTVPVLGTPYRPVAAGYFTAAGIPKGPVYNNLIATQGATAGDFFLNFSGYQSANNYIVKGTVQDSNAAAATRATVEYVGQTNSGIWIRILDTSSKVLGAALGFMVEVSQIGGTS